MKSLELEALRREVERRVRVGGSTGNKEACGMDAQESGQGGCNTGG